MTQPLDRTWYNTLIDDNGTGTTGTIWNKAAVDALLDSVDASLGTVVDKTGTPAANLIAIFNDADTLQATPAIGVDVTGGLKLDSPTYAYVQLNDQSQPANGRVFQIGASAGTLRLMSMSDVGAVLGQLEMRRDGRIVPSAGQITFPTTQKPSTDPNTIDDYREGIGGYQPSLVSSAGQNGQVYTIREGNFIKIGRFVFVAGRILLSTLGTYGAGNLAITLPFTATASLYAPGGLQVFGGSGLTIPISSLSGSVSAGDSVAYLTYLPGAGGVGFASLPSTALQAGTDLSFTGTYIAAN